MRGSAPIPFDMMRYDACYPSRESEDAAALERMTLVDHASAVVTFEHVGHIDWHPTERRWASFMWQVMPGTHTKDPL